MLLGYMVTFPVAIKLCKALLERSLQRANVVSLYGNVPGRDQMLYGSILTLLVEIKCCKAIYVRFLWRPIDKRLYCNVPG